MKGAYNDTLWFKNADGGDVKISMGGFPKEEIERLKRQYEANGWKVVSHKHTIRSFWNWIPKWFWPYAAGVIIGSVSLALFQTVFNK